MRATDVTLTTRHPFALAVRASGGHDFQLRVSTAQFEQALRESLSESGLFPRLVELGRGDLRLDVVLGDDRGMEGRELTVLWSLSRVDDQRIVWQQLIRSRGKSNHFVGVVRQRRSVELAAQDNIRKGIEALSRADLPPRAE